MGMRTATLQDIAQEVLSPGVVCLTGGRDIANTPILVFPSHTQSHLELWSSDRLLQLLRHYLQWLAVTSQIRTVACLANLQNSSKNVIAIVVEAVEKLELSSRGTVSALYFMKPHNKTRSKLLKKLLGLKPSKKHPKIPLFKVILLKTAQDVFSQIDLCHLTPEFGGTLEYDHEAWLKFHQMVAPCVRCGQAVVKKFPDVKDRLELLQDCDTHNQSVQDIQTRLTELTESYHMSIKEAQFQVSLDKCKQCLLTLDTALQQLQQHEHQQEKPNRPATAGKALTIQAAYLTRVHITQLESAAECLRDLYNRMSTQRWQLEELWRDIENNITVHLQIQKHRERAAEMEKRLKTQYQPLLKDHPCVGATLSQAELYRTHFTTTLYEPAKELLSQATEMLQDVQRLREKTSPPCDVSDILQTLTVALQPFAQQLQSLQDIYVAVHIFHMLFQKALMWYRKVLRFLPEGLQKLAEESAVADGTGRHAVQMPLEWQVTVQSFLNKHPPPREQHLARLDTHIPPQVEKRLRVQARSLALRLRLLQRLLCSRRLPVKLLTTIFRWRAEVNNASNTSNSVSGRSSSPQDNRPGPRGRILSSSREELSSKAGDSTRSGKKSPVPSLLSQPQQQHSSAPLKPARLFDTLRSVSSFSSSDAGDLDYAHMNLLGQTEFALSRDLSYAQSYFSDQDDTDPSSVNGDWDLNPLEQRQDAASFNQQPSGMNGDYVYSEKSRQRQNRNRFQSHPYPDCNERIEDEQRLGANSMRNKYNLESHPEDAEDGEEHGDATSEDVLKYKIPPPLDIKILSRDVSGVLPHQDLSREISGVVVSEENRSRTYWQDQKAHVNKERLASKGEREEGERENNGYPEEKDISEKERFIRLTFSPAGSTQTTFNRPQRQRRRRESRESSSREDAGLNGIMLIDDHFDSEQEEQSLFRFPDAPTGSESGIEVADHLDSADPWDSVMKRIKAVSNSSLPSDVKIQCVSHLLTRSTLNLSSDHSPGHHLASEDRQLRAGALSAGSSGALSASRIEQGGKSYGVGPFGDMEMDEFGILRQRCASFDQLDADKRPLRSWDYNRPGSSLGGFYRLQECANPPQRNHSFVIADVKRDRYRPRRHESFVTSSNGREVNGGARHGAASRRGQGRYEKYSRKAADRIYDRTERFFASDQERPAQAVAKLRQRLARSLMDLDDIDNKGNDGDVLTTNQRSSRADGNDQRYSARVYRSYNSDTEFNRDHVGLNNRIRSGTPTRRPQYTGRPESAETFLDEDKNGFGKGRLARKLSRSYDTNLDSLHHETPTSSRVAAHTLVSWRSHEDGLDSLSHHRTRLPWKDHGDIGTKTLSPSKEDGIDSFISPGSFYAHYAHERQTRSKHRNAVQHNPRSRENESEILDSVSAELMIDQALEGQSDQRYATGSNQKAKFAVKDPRRWRLGIDLDLRDTSAGLNPNQSPPPGKTHQKSKHFIAPTFLKPYLHLQGDLDTSLTQFSDLDLNGARTSHDTADMKEGEMSSRFGIEMSPFNRLSDEVDKEYMSQDEVESSLKRSQRILMKAEERLKERRSKPRETTQSSEETADNSVLSALHLPSPKPEDLQVTPENVGHTRRSPNLEENARRIPNTGRNTREVPKNVEPLHNSSQLRPNHNDVQDDDCHDDATDVADDDGDIWEDSSFLSLSPLPMQIMTTSQQSAALSADVDWDADVSNISDAVSEFKRH